MAFTLKSRVAGEVTVIDMSGRLTCGPGAAQLREMLQSVMGSGARKVLVNLNDVAFVDTSGLGELAAGYTRAQHEGIALKLICPPNRVRHVFEMTGLSRILDIHDDEAGALLSWSENTRESSRGAVSVATADVSVATADVSVATADVSVATAMEWLNDGTTSVPGLTAAGS